MKTSYRGHIGGFTLIELLVVVLIIGILSAVALPQYQKAVFKSRMAEAFTNLKTMADAIKVCELENGKPDENNLTCFRPSNLVVNIGDSEDNANCSRTEKFQYCIDRGDLSTADNVVANALARDFDVCVCLYEDGHFSVNNEEAGCLGGTFPNFDVAKALNLPADEGCYCC